MPDQFKLFEYRRESIPNYKCTKIAILEHYDPDLFHKFGQGFRAKKRNITYYEVNMRLRQAIAYVNSTYLLIYS